MPLVFRATNESHTAFAAMSGRLTVGGIRKDKFSNNIDKWSWYVSAVTGPSSIVQGQGFGDDLEACKAALEANWGRWLELAELEERR
jgi:hypothetical protein